MRNQHQHLHDVVKRDVTTIDGSVVSVVYVTAEPTFTGVIGGYTTSDEDSSPSTAAQSSPAAATTANAASKTSDPFSYNTSTFAGYTSSSPSAAASTAAASSNINSGAFSSASSPSFASSTNQQSSPSSTGTSSTSSDASTDSSSSANSGMSTAGKAGLAVGIILVIGAVLALALFLLGKKKRQVKADQAREDSEKNAAIAAARNPPVNAPRLSLRPASSFLPEFMGGARPKSRLSQAGMLGGPSNEPNAAREKYLAGQSQAQQNIPMTEKSAPTENPFKDPENPFADNAHPAAQHSASESARVPQPTPKALPMPTPAAAPAPVAMPEPITAPSDRVAAAAVASAGAVAAAQAAMRHGEAPARPQPSRPEPVEMPSPPIGVPAPLATPKSNAGPNGTPDGQVYRILMDFIPSMEDELELKSGQVVRMLHEYDDGWCLCTRLDRSQQGVVPRTCLAAKPSKPRPGPGPNSQRPMSPAMNPNQGRAMSPAMNPNQGRSMSPAMRNGPPPPMSAGPGRSMSPGPQGRPPMGAQGRPMSPARGPPQNGMRPMSPGAYNQAPRPLSPGPRSSQQSRRAQSPGPYGHAGGPQPMAPNQRRRSNSSSAAARDVRDRRASPPGPSPLGGFAPGMAI